VAQIDNVTTRRAEPEDANLVARLHADSWRRHYRGAYSDAFLDDDVETDRLKVWTERLTTQDGKTATFMAEDDGTFCGFIHLVFDNDPVWGSLVDNLHVVWTRKGGGIGSRLMAEAANAVLGRGNGGLYLWVLEQNEAGQAFYRSRGGVCTGRRLVTSPGGVPGRLNGAPLAFRFAWEDPAALIS
jgi:ribosomal protein S18 acetylase RimI-like enzyme